jgi:hypothetical protein
MRPNVDPSSNKKDTKNTRPFVFENFSRGTIQDPPASEIQDALSDSLNLTIFPGFYEGRIGCKLFTNARFPHIEGRDGYSAHKAGNRIVSDSGNIFLLADVGRFWCWGDHYEFITEWISETEVRTESSTYYAGINCNITAAPNAFFWHQSLRIWILLLGTEVYIAEWNIPSWQKVFAISRDEPFDNKSDEAEYLDFAFLFNGNGLFKVEPDATYPITYKVSIDPPNIKLNSVESFTGATARYRYLYSAARLERQGIIVDRQTPSIISEETGTNIADERDQDFSEVYTRHEISTRHPNLVTELWVPVVPNSYPVEYQWHLTHFPIWRSFDLEAKDPEDVNKEKFNDPRRFIWAKDLRICAALYVRIEGNRMYALRGEFELADTYSIVEIDTHERFEILEYISETEVRIAGEYYDYSARGPYAAVIGNGKVFRATVTGSVLTRTHGDEFHSGDLRKTIYNSEGYRFYITEVFDTNRVRLHIEGDQPVQGFTMDPIHRKFYDTIDDTQLRARKDFYSCYGRYRQALPNCNLGKIMPGFMIMAYRTQKKIYYSHIQSKMDYLIGQYIPTQVSDEVQDAIQCFWLFQDILSIFCATSTWGIAVGISDFMTLPQSNEAIAILNGVKVVDKHIGCMDHQSIKEVENGVVELVTNEPGGEALRQFNGTSYSEENFLVDSSLGGRIVRAMEKTKKLSAAIYDGFMGYILWRKRA